MAPRRPCRRTGRLVHCGGPTHRRGPVLGESRDETARASARFRCLRANRSRRGADGGRDRTPRTDSATLRRRRSRDQGFPPFRTRCSARDDLGVDVVRSMVASPPPRRVQDRTPRPRTAVCHVGQRRPGRPRRRRRLDTARTRTLGSSRCSTSHRRTDHRRGRSGNRRSTRATRRTRFAAGRRSDPSGGALLQPFRLAPMVRCQGHRAASSAAVHV